MKLDRWADFALHVLLPNKCMFCAEPVEYDRLLCDVCAENLPLTDLSRCLLCGRPVPQCACARDRLGFSRLTAPFYYELGADNAIRDIKFNGNFLTARKLALYMAAAVQRSGLASCFDRIVPVPLTPRDERRRGFNQSAKLAEWTAHYLEKPMQAELLSKIRQTAKQHDLDAAKRRENLRGVFRAAPEKLAGQRILLVDDVFTTGATLSECARALREAGAAEVFALAAAKTRRAGDSDAP